MLHPMMLDQHVGFVQTGLKRYCRLGGPAYIVFSMSYFKSELPRQRYLKRDGPVFLLFYTIT